MNLIRNNIYNNNFIDRFNFNKRLGSGSFSDVYSVFDKKNNREVALKINKINNTNFDNEISILSNLKQKERHNITKMFESFSYNHKQYIIFKMYNISLKEYIKGNESSITKTLDIINQISKCLVFLKKHSIIHCDIKPENILFRDNLLNSIVVIDFGISINNNYTIDRNKMIQTIYYRAPEILIGTYFDYKIDIWSLGCVIYEIFYRKPLFQFKKTDELFLNQNILLDHPPYEFIKKFPKIYPFYDNIDSPSYLIYDNNIYAFKNYNFIAIHKEKQIIDLVLKCCQWEPKNRPIPENLVTL